MKAILDILEEEKRLVDELNNLHREILMFSQEERKTGSVYAANRRHLAETRAADVYRLLKELRASLCWQV